MHAYTNSSEWMKKTVSPNENMLRVTQGALSREAALPTQPYVFGKVLHFDTALRRPLWRRIFSLFYIYAANPFIRSIYTFRSTVIVLFLKTKALLEKLLAVNRPWFAPTSISWMKRRWGVRVKQCSENSCTLLKCSRQFMVIYYQQKINKPISGQNACRRTASMRKLCCDQICTEDASQMASFSQSKHCWKPPIKNMTVFFLFKSTAKFHFRVSLICIGAICFKNSSSLIGSMQ